MKKRAGIILTVVSLSALVCADPDTNILSIGIFSKCIEHNLPCGWEKFKEIKGISLQNDSTGYFVNITSMVDVEGIGTRKEFNIKKFPWMHWRWKARVLPLGACENIKKKSDSGAGLYIAFKGMFPFMHIIKYTWSSTLPVGTIIKSPFYGGARIFVIESGPANLKTWISEERNVYDDYRRAFGNEPPPAEGIALQSDSDNTRTSASADFADIFLSKEK